MTEALAFWAVALVIAALALPLAFRLFARFPDAGAGLSFTLGLTLVAAGYFFLRLMAVLPAGRGGFLVAIVLFGLVMFVIAARDHRFLSILRRSLPGVTGAAVLFSVLFFGYAVFRAYMPDIAHTEQPMDFLYLNAMLASPDYPPHDPWFAGEDASYHYGGYLQAAVLTGASDVWPATGYNLSLGAVFASAGAAAFSLATALAGWFFGVRERRWSMLAGAGAVVLLLFAGPLASVFEFASAHGADHEGVYNAFGAEGLVRCGTGTQETCVGQPLDTSSAWYPDDHWVWWRMSRMAYWGPRPFIPEEDRYDDHYPVTVTETPSFSFILGDLHPHVMSIPGVLLALALCAAIWRGEGRLSLRDHVRRPWLMVVVALVFGSLAFVNVWDVVAFSPLLALAVLARNLRTASFGEATADAVSWLLPPAVLAVAAFAPWWVDFSPQRGGIYAYSGQGTRVEHALLMWGTLIVFALPVLWWTLSRWRPALFFLSTSAPLALWRTLRRFRSVPSRLRSLASPAPWRRLRSWRSALPRLRPRSLSWLWPVLRRWSAALWAGSGRLARGFLDTLGGLPRWWAAFRASPLLVALVLALLPFLIWLPVAADHRTAAPFETGDGLSTALAARTAGAWVTLALYAVAFWLLAATALLLNRRHHPATPVATLGALGVLLLYVTELFLLRDALFFLPRLNTVFKLSYQAWIVLSVAGAVGAVAAVRAAPPLARPVAVGLIVVLLGSSLVFAVTNVPNRAGGFDAMVGLDGLRYVKRLDPAEYELVRWLNDNVERGDIVVESSGRSWTRDEDGRPVLAERAGSYRENTSRVGYRTGLQIPIGWPGHETTWRGNSPEVVDGIWRRQELVDLVYTASSQQEVLAALDEIGASYVVVGRLERSHYGDLIPPFERFLDLVFLQGDVAVYRVTAVEEVVTR